MSRSSDDQAIPSFDRVASVTSTRHARISRQATKRSSSLCCPRREDPRSRKAACLNRQAIEQPLPPPACTASNDLRRASLNRQAIEQPLLPTFAALAVGRRRPPVVSIVRRLSSLCYQAIRLSADWTVPCLNRQAIEQPLLRDLDPLVPLMPRERVVSIVRRFNSLCYARGSPRWRFSCSRLNRQAIEQPLLLARAASSAERSGCLNRQAIEQPLLRAGSKWRPHVSSRLNRQAIEQPLLRGRDISCCHDKVGLNRQAIEQPLLPARACSALAG